MYPFKGITPEAYNKKNNLEVIASDPNAEVFLINSRFQRIAKGVGGLEVLDVSPGLYTLKYKIGNLFKEEGLIIYPGTGKKFVQGPEMDISTAVPLVNSSNAYEYHLHYASEQSKIVHKTEGNGGQLFLFVRDLDKRGRTNPSRGLSLYYPDGREIVDFTEVGQSNFEKKEAAWSACTIELDPGAYILKNRTGGIGTLEQIVIICDEWQTQIFMFRRSFGSGKKGRRADMADASILMARKYEGFNPDREDLKWTEIAKKALMNDRSGVGSELKDMLWAKFENPMLGIYGAHLLLKKEEFDSSLFETVIGNLLGLVGDHPDVLSLKFQIDSRRNANKISSESDLPIFNYPPMLQASWNLILKASVQYPQIIPIDSFAAQVSLNTLNTCAWLIWRKTNVSDIEESQNLDEEYHLDSLISEIRNSLSESDLDDLVKKYRLNNMEKQLLGYLDPVLNPKNILGKKNARKLKKDESEEYFSDDILVENFGVPKSLIDNAKIGLTKKLMKR